MRRGVERCGGVRRGGEAYPNWEMGFIPFFTPRATLRRWP